MVVSGWGTRVSDCRDDVTSISRTGSSQLAQVSIVMSMFSASLGVLATDSVVIGVVAVWVVLAGLVVIGVVSFGGVTIGSVEAPAGRVG